MIKLDGIPSILESIYLGEPLTSRVQDISIEVNPNPKCIKFLSSKLIIINTRDYVLGDERGYGNMFISRVKGYQGVKYIPYIPRILPRIMWNGETVSNISEAADSLTFKNDILYFPKISGYTEEHDDLDFLGYLEYQVGYNFYDSPMRDLDILKCREGLLD